MIGFLQWLLRKPAFWTFVVTIVAYCDKTSLHGSFVYDDAGSVKRNVVVSGNVPWREVFFRDFWGTPMHEGSSHKSFRPITTLSFRLNWILAHGTKEDVESTLGFHLVNVLLHGIIVWLSTEATGYVFQSSNSQKRLHAQVLVGLLFGLHPVHAEVVSNITSRGELLMSLFCLMAFLSYAPHVLETSTNEDSLWKQLKRFFALYAFPWLMMTLSVFSKEQGATTLISLVAFDFVVNVKTIPLYFKGLRDGQTWQFTKRAFVLACQTLLVCAWRVSLNGETKPDFISDQNPAGFAEDRFTRIFSVNWVYCLYIWDALVPTRLCCDWSGNSIPLITSWRDVRVLGVLVLWTFVGWNVRMLFVTPSTTANPPEQQLGRTTFGEIRRVVLLSFFAFTFSPFLLSSNLLVVVGLMKADRVIYLPLLGLCMLEALVVQCLFVDSIEIDHSKPKGRATIQKDRRAALRFPSRSGRYRLGYLLLIAQLVWLTRLLYKRNLAWSSNLNLWLSAYDVNPISYHTQYNCGYELSLKGYYHSAEEVLRPIGSAHVNGPSNTFVYAMVLYNLNRKKEAEKYADEALEVIKEKETTHRTAPVGSEDYVRNRPELLARTKSNLLVAKALAQDNLRETGLLMYQAVNADSTNAYAISQAQNVMNKLKELDLL